jgi:hypothetical protein
MERATKCAGIVASYAQQSHFKLPVASTPSFCAFSKAAHMAALLSGVAKK